MSGQYLMQGCDQGHCMSNVMGDQYFKDDGGQRQPSNLKANSKVNFLGFPIAYTHPGVNSITLHSCPSKFSLSVYCKGLGGYSVNFELLRPYSTMCQITLTSQGQLH